MDGTQKQKLSVVTMGNVSVLSVMEYLERVLANQATVLLIVPIVRLTDTVIVAHFPVNLVIMVARVHRDC